MGSLSDRRAKYAAKLADRHKESYDRRDDSGKYKSVLRKDKIKGIDQWKCSEDDHNINIIPFMAGPNNPNVPEGEPCYNIDYFMHRKVGVNEDNYVCLARSFKGVCPICDEQTRLRKRLQDDDVDKQEADDLEKAIKALNPVRRVIYNIEVLDTPKEQAKGIQLWEVSHFLFEKELAEAAKKKKGGGFVTFSHPDEGKIVSFRRVGKGATTTSYKAFSFEDREEPISDKLLDSALVLDEIIHIPTTEEVETAFFGRATVSEDDEQAPPEKPKETKQAEKPKEEEQSLEESQEENDVPDPVEGECPAGGDFGVDNMAYDVCPDCEFAELCTAKAQEIAEQKEAARLERLAKANEKKNAASAAKEEPAKEAPKSPVTRTRNKIQR